MTIKDSLLNAIAAQVDRRRESQKLAGDPKHQAHLEIRAHRFDLRHLYLAYALERGIAYERLEKTCRFKPSVDVIVDLTGGEPEAVEQWLVHRDIKPENVTEVPRVEAQAAHAV